MLNCKKKAGRQPRALHAAFTLIELLISMALLALVMAGIVYGFAQANRFAEWNSMSLAAQSYALQGLEQVRSAKWDLWANPVIDVMPAPTNFTQTDIMDIPVSGAPYYCHQLHQADTNLDVTATARGVVPMRLGFPAHQASYSPTP